MISFSGFIPFNGFMMALWLDPKYMLLTSSTLRQRIGSLGLDREHMAS